MPAGRKFALFFTSAALLLACNTGPAEPTASTTAAASPAPTTAPAAIHLGQAIEASTATTRLADIAKDPRKFDKTTVATTGTVTAVCQHRGCWMEIKDDSSEAHIRMAGHAFMVPRTSSGKKAKVLAQVQLSGEEPACEESEGETMSTNAGPAAPGAKKEKKGCRAEAEEQMGHPLPKLELVALGVEIYG